MKRCLSILILIRILLRSGRIGFFFFIEGSPYEEEDWKLVDIDGDDDAKTPASLALFGAVELWENPFLDFQIWL